MMIRIRTPEINVPPHLEHILSTPPCPSPPTEWGSPFYLCDVYRLRALKTLLPSSGGDLLDYGCGDKPYENVLNTKETWTWTGADLPVRTTGTPSHAELTIENDRVPRADASFDVILSTQVLEHVPSLERTMREMARLLKPGGSIIATCPLTSPLHELPHDYRRLTPFGLDDTARSCGLHLTRAISLGGPVSTILTLFCMHLNPISRLPLVGNPIRKHINGCLLRIGRFIEWFLFKIGFRQTDIAMDWAYRFERIS